MRLRSGTDMGNDLCRTGRADACAQISRFVLGISIQESGGEQIPGPCGIDHRGHRGCCNLISGIAFQHDRALRPPGDGGDFAVAAHFI